MYFCIFTGLVLYAMLRRKRLFRIQFAFVNFKLCESENCQPLNKNNAADSASDSPKPETGSQSIQTLGDA